jgi:hypothetical protein
VFWEGLRGEIDFQEADRLSIPVKGTAFHQPTRFLEIFSDTDEWLQFYRHIWRKNNRDPEKQCGTLAQINSTFLPYFDGKPMRLTEGAHQPPFAWRDASIQQLCASFTYNTNAFFRILSLLQGRGLVEQRDVVPLLDQACLLLSLLYRAEGGFLLRNLNNNFNMYLISRVVEYLVGKERYDSDRQEAELTQQSLRLALSWAGASCNLGIIDKMGFAVGRGVAFLESQVLAGIAEARIVRNTENVAHRYYAQPLAIDHRGNLLRSVAAAGQRGRFDLAVILDDATESVDDFVWLMDLMRLFPYFRAHLIVNSAQISVNFSSHMLGQVLQHPAFSGLRDALGKQIFITEIYCPLISFQTNYLPGPAMRAIACADAVYIKGANFFETCQIKEKDTYHAFVVFGPVSRMYTGLRDFDAIFAHLPAGTIGYEHKLPPERVVTLLDMVGHRGESENNLNSGGACECRTSSL